MNRWLFRCIVSLLYLVACYCGYKAWYIYSNVEDQMKSETMVVYNGGSVVSQNEIDDPSKGEKDVLQAEMTGYIAATVTLILLPTLMIGFKRRLISD